MKNSKWIQNLKTLFVRMKSEFKNIFNYVSDSVLEQHTNLLCNQPNGKDLMRREYRKIRD